MEGTELHPDLTRWVEHTADAGANFSALSRPARLFIIRCVHKSAGATGPPLREQMAHGKNH